MMPSSSQVLDHQLIFHIMYGLGQFHHRQNKEGVVVGAEGVLVGEVVGVGVVVVVATATTHQQHISKKTETEW